MVKQSVWIGIAIGVFFAGLGIGYGVFQSAQTNFMPMTTQQMQQMMNNPEAMNNWMNTMMQNSQFSQWMMEPMRNNPPMMPNMMNPWMNDPQLQQQMYDMMLQNQQFMQGMMNNQQFQQQWMGP